MMKVLSKRFTQTSKGAALVVAVAMTCAGRTHAQPQLPKITPETTLSDEQLEDALKVSDEQLAIAKQFFDARLQELGPGHPHVVGFKYALEKARQAHALQQQLFPLLAGPRDDDKQKEIERLIKELNSLPGLDLPFQGHDDAAHKKAAEAKLRAAHAKEQELTAMQQQLEHARQQLDNAKQQLQQRQMQLEQAAKQMAAQRDRPMPPLENAELRIFRLKHVAPTSAANAIETLFGADSMRVAVDERTKSLILLTKPDSLKVIESLLMNLDEKASDEREKDQPQPSKEDARKSLLLRLFWLGDDVQGTVAEEVLPASVVLALKKLGLGDPILITQTVSSLAAGGNDATEFSAEVPALLSNRNVLLSYSGKITLPDGDKPSLAMHVDVRGEGLNCNLQGSMAMPLGHYMVLGTANSVLPELAAPVDRGPQPFVEGAFAPGGPGRMPAEKPQVPVKFSTTRFAFVVQVIEAESFAPEKQE